MKLLAVDTATEACSAALWIDGDVRESYELAGNGHSKIILPMIDELMAEAGLKPQQLDALSFGRGPGSFTGIRIATGIIQGIAFACDLPVVPVSNLAAVAQDFFDSNTEGNAFVAMDARMGEIYWGVYGRDRDGIAVLKNEEKVIPAERIDYPEKAGVGIGTGWNLYHEPLAQRLGGKLIRFETGNLPRAAAIAKLGCIGFPQGLSVQAEAALPVYLRDKVAKKESER
jgi:tRNA threonylcarbamoyladenosine biosynthesis protein TsaB